MRNKVRVMPHPVWVKKNAVNPRNQKNKLTADDKHRFYAAKNAKTGDSIVDLMNEIIKFNEWVNLFRR